MEQSQPLPAGLAEMPPGPELAALLGGLDPSRLSGFDCVEAVVAQYRQVNHERARLLTMIAEVALRDDPAATARCSAISEFAADEVRAALAWSRRHAQDMCDLARDLTNRLPAVLAALSAGGIDEAKARIFSEYTLQLSDEQARAVCDGLLPQAARWTCGQLIERMRRWAIAIDPGWAGRRYRQAIAQRRLVARTNPDGSADLCGLDLPIDQVAAATARIEGLAKAAKRAGHPDPLDHVRVQLFLGLTDGSYEGMTDTEILARVLSTVADTSTATTAADPRVGEFSGGTNGRATDDRATASDPTRETATDGSGSADGAAPGHHPRPALNSRPVDRRIELRVRLSTVLHWDRHPGELAGWGPVHAELARHLITENRSVQWRYVLTDPHGYLSQVGLLRSRPVDKRAPAAAATATVLVELQVDPVTLDALTRAGHDHGPWTAVVAELVRSAATPARALSDDPARRAPLAALRRLIQVRDRACLFPGCRAPAGSADIDHSTDHAHGGPTVESNLGSMCRHDHRLNTPARDRYVDDQR